MAFKKPVGQSAGQQVSDVVRAVGVLDSIYRQDTWIWLDFDNIPDLYATPPGGDPLDPNIVVKLDPTFPSLAPVAAYCAARASASAFPALAMAAFGLLDVLDFTAPAPTGGTRPPLVIVPPPPPTA